MVRHSATLAGCWLACLVCTTSAASEYLRRSRTALHKSAAGRSQWKIAEDGFLGWMSKRQGRGMPAGCNCQGKTTGPCGAGAAAFVFATPAPTTTMPAPAQPPIPPPPPPPPLPGPPPPLPLAPAKPLPGLPGLPGITVALLPTLGPPPLAKMTPPPTMPPPVTTPPPPTTPGPTTPAWVETPMGLIAGTTPNPWLKFTTTTPTTTPAPPLPGILAQTILEAVVDPGSKILMVANQDNFIKGNQVVIDGGTEREEINKIVGFGSIILESPLVFSHAIGCNVTMSTKQLNATQFAAFKNASAQRAKNLAAAEEAASEVAKTNLETARKTEKERILAEAAAERAKEEAAQKAAKGGAVLLETTRTKGPLSFLYRSFNRLTERQPFEEECNCPCADTSIATVVDQSFNSIMSQP